MLHRGDDTFSYVDPRVKPLQERGLKQRLLRLGSGFFCKRTIHRPMSLMETRSLGETRSFDGGRFVAESF